MSLQPHRPTFAAGLVERGQDNLLIALAEEKESSGRLWQFPRTLVQPDESPEAAIRRFIAKDLGSPIEIIIAQPPFLTELDGEEVEMRYVICGAEVPEDMMPGPYCELRWIPRHHLVEYELDSASSPVAEWLLNE